MVRSRYCAALGMSLFYTDVALYCIHAEHELCKGDVFIM